MTRLALLAEVLAATLPPTGRALETVRMAGVDLMGCVLAGRAEAPTLQARVALAERAPGPAPLFGTGVRSAAPVAALCNSVASHALELDDWEVPGNTHPTMALLPPLWALASEQRLDGPTAAAAYAAGFAVIARLGEAVNYGHYARGWHSTSTLGTVGAAAAVARALSLDPGATAHALSMALGRAAGFTCQFGSTAKALQAGLGARIGFEAALLAAQGATGQAAALDGPGGFLALMGGGDLDRLDAALGRLGRDALDKYGLVIKPYPSCGYSHRMVDCALDIAARRGFRAADVVTAEAVLPELHAAVMTYPRPVDAQQARFSLPFCVATALLRGRLTVADFTAEALGAADVAALAGRIGVRPFAPRRPDLTYDPDEPDRLTLGMADGSRLTASCAYPLGTPQVPMSADGIRAKAAAVSGIPSAALWQAASGWPEAPDLAEALGPFEADLPDP